MLSATPYFTLNNPNLKTEYPTTTVSDCVSDLVSGKNKSATQYRLSPTQAVGLRWETWAADQLAEKGWEVATPADFSAPYDLLISRPFGHTLPVEVKVARVTMRRVRPGYYKPRYQWLLRAPKSFDRLFILIALSQETGQIVPFIVPSWALGDRTHVQLTSSPERYQGKILASYKFAWIQARVTYDVVKRFQAIAAGQLSLFSNIAQGVTQ